jgi:hypothetical protein
MIHMYIGYIVIGLYSNFGLRQCCCYSKWEFVVLISYALNLLIFAKLLPHSCMHYFQWDQFCNTIKLGAFVIFVKFNVH